MSERRENQIFIHAPELRRRHRRAGDQLLTLFMWGIYAYLWLPFISLVAWYLGIDLFYQEMVIHGGFEAFLSLSGWYLLIIFLILLTVAGWSTSNYLRFHDRDRRRVPSEVGDEEIAAWFRVDPGALAGMKKAGRLEMKFDSHGHLSRASDSQSEARAVDSRAPASSA